LKVAGRYEDRRAYDLGSILTDKMSQR
jgi:hypothetical protein